MNKPILIRAVPITEYGPEELDLLARGITPVIRLTYADFAEMYPPVEDDK